MRSRTLFAFAVGALAASGLLAAACASDDGIASGGDGDETGVPSRGDGSTTTDGGGADAPADAKADVLKVTRDANGPGAADAACSFNYDCQLALRCACDETTGCACASGARGTGQNAVDKCDSGDQCASAVCVEGPPDSGFYCSEPCDTVAECQAPLPNCLDVSFVGRICVRATPK
jgi:hypothetical protein